MCFGVVALACDEVKDVIIFPMLDRHTGTERRTLPATTQLNYVI